MATVEQISKVKMFSELSDNTKKEIAQLMQSITVAKGKNIVKKGDVAREMFFIISGTVKIIDDSSEEINEKLLTSGAFFGELGLIYNIPRTVTVVAETDVNLCILQKEDLISLYGFQYIFIISSTLFITNY